MKKYFFIALMLGLAALLSACETDGTVTQAQLKEICKDQPNDFDCYDAYYEAFVNEKDVAQTMDDMKARYAADPFVQAQCHQMMHVIGRTAAKKYGTIPEAFKRGDHFCWSGYFHGVMEGTLAKVDSNQLDAEINGVCDEVAGKETYSFDYFNCVHGLGHGVMYITNDELFDSLTHCNALDGWWEKQSCYGGVYMENVIVDGKNHVTKYLKPEEPLYPCTAVHDYYKEQCYLMQTSYMLKLAQYDFSKVFEQCGGAEEPYIDTCYQSLGRDASGQSNSRPEKTRQFCLLGKDFREQSNCVIGAVKDFISYHHSDVQARQLCAALPEDLKTVCDEQVAPYYEQFESPYGKAL